MQTLTPEAPPAPAAEPVSATFMWDRAEHRRLIAQITRHAKLRRWARWSPWLMPAAAVFALVMPVLQGDVRGLSVTGPWALILLAWFALFRWGNPWFAARAYPKQHPCVKSPFHVALTDEGIRTTCDHSDVLVKWAGVRRAIETREFLLFYTTERCALYLPKRAVDPARMDHARSIVLRHLPLVDAGS